MEPNIKRQGRVLLYHDISEIPGPYIKHLAISHQTSAFEKQLEYLVTKYSFVPFSEFVSSKDCNEKACLTFDDGYKSFQQFALPVLEHFSIPVKMYLNSGAVFGDIPWLNKLSWLIDNLPQEELIACAQEALHILLDIKRHVVRQFVDHFQKGVTNRIIDQYYLHYCKDAENPNLFLNKQDLDDLRGHPLIEWGSHSVSHWPLNRLDKSTIYTEITECHRELQRILGPCLTGVSIPFSRLNGKEREIYLATKSITDSIAVGETLPKEVSSINKLKLIIRKTAPFSFRKLRILMGDSSKLRPKNSDLWYKKTRTINFSELESYAESIKNLPESSLIPITKSRARVMRLNPHASDGDLALVVIEDAENKVLAYWGLMPSLIITKGKIRKIFWSSTGESMPYLRGKGLADAIFRRITEEVDLLCANGNSRGAQGMFRHLGLTEAPRPCGLDLRIIKLNPLVYREKLINRFKISQLPRDLKYSSKILPIKTPDTGLHSILKLLGKLSGLKIRWCQDQFSDDALRFLEKDRNDCFYRSGSAIEWMASSPLSQDTIETDRVEDSYYFSPRHRVVSFLRLEAASKSSHNITAAALLSYTIDKRNCISKLKILDFAHNSRRGRLLILIAAVITAWQARAHILSIPIGIIPSSVIKLLPSSLLKRRKENYFFYCKDSAFMDCFVALNTSLADGDQALS